MESGSVELKVRVIVVTTRAALRHADTDRARRRDIVGRGRALLESLAAEATDHAGLIDRARADLDEMLAE